MYHKFCYPCNLPFLVSQKWGENPTFYNTINLKGHNGWDFAVVIGTPIYACHDGVVFASGTTNDGALQIEINTLDGAYRTFYGHLSELKVVAGDKVIKGQLIGLSGNTGRYTTGPHLHFGIHPLKDNKDSEQGNGYNGAVDPVHFFDGTYPNTKVSIKDDTKFNNMMLAIRDFQVSQGIMDFKDETNPKKINLGPRTLKAIKEYK